MERFDEVLPVFVRDPAILGGGRMAPTRTALLERTLASLDSQLRARGGRLIVRTGDPAEVIPALIVESGATEVHAQRDTTPFARRRFARVAERVPLRLHAGLLLVEPEAVGEARVFAAFYRRWTSHPIGNPLAPPERIRVPDDVVGEPVAAATTADSHAEANARLNAFATAGAEQYATDRNRLDVDGTSRLSAALHLGLLSARQIANAVDSEAFRRELAWRDWASHLLWWRPDALRDGWNATLGAVRWPEDHVALAAWQEGRTGYPTVDAAMRQLKLEGWIHNRARMIVASFLAKDLLLDWRVGEAWFLRHLVDGDVANNSLGWQWTAGAGTDAAPYVRILNPSLQGERFDSHGTWVRRWLPELRDVPDRWIHRPWASPDGPPAGYPSPIVDHLEARQRAITFFRSVP